MSDDPKGATGRECTVCYSAHDEEIHQATLSIHRWFYYQVTHDFEDTRLELQDAGTEAAA